jgi:hypothetical protein
VKVQLHVFLTSAVDGGEWSASRPGHFSTGIKAHGTHWIGGLAGITAGLDAVAKRKISNHCPRRELNPGRSTFEMITIKYFLDLLSF